jgi:hypothetical protein
MTRPTGDLAGVSAILLAAVSLGCIASAHPLGKPAEMQATAPAEVGLGTLAHQPEASEPACPQGSTGWWRDDEAWNSSWYPARLRCGNAEYKGKKTDWCHFSGSGGACGGGLNPEETDVLHYIEWPKGLPLEVVTSGAVAQQARLRVYRWPDTTLTGKELEGERITKMIENRWYTYSLVREVLLIPTPSMRWPSDVPAGRYLVVIKTSYEVNGEGEYVELAYPVEFRN